jgi:UDP:flavonoid glycosyltransferase YjiC (YdhE family)
MPRILCTTCPMSGHVQPILPIISELTGMGNDVLWCTAPEFETAVTAAGARFAAIGDRVDFHGALSRVGGRPGLAGLNQAVLEFFLKPVPSYVSDLIPVFDSFRPDVVVADSSFRAGIFLAEQRGIGRVAVAAGPLNVSSPDIAPFGFGLKPPATMAGRLRNRFLSWAMREIVFREAQRTAVRIRAEMGLPPLAGFFIDWVPQVANRYLQNGIPDYEYPRRDLPASVLFVGPLFDRRAAEWARPAWWPELASARAAGRQVVFVTQGTVATDPDSLVRPAIDGLGRSDALIVVAAGGHDPDEVIPARQRPANLRIAPFIPYTDVLPVADVMVTNGGFAGVVTALAYGVPLVACGASEDKREVGARVAWSGAGVSLGTSRPRPDRLRQAVHAVLTEPSYRSRAREIAAAHAGYQGAAGAAKAILEVAGSVRPAP